jgi:hypothetical protein
VHRHRRVRDAEGLAAETLVDAQPRVEREPVLARPAGVPLHGNERIGRLQRRAHRCDESAEPVPARNVAHRLDHDRAERAALAIRPYDGLQRAQRRRRDTLREPLHAGG